MLQEIFIQIKENFMITLTLLIMLGALVGTNTLLGSVMAIVEGDFDWTKFWKSLVKALLIGVCILIFCLVMDTLPVVLSWAKVELPEGILTFIEIIAVIVMAISKYAVDIYEKLLCLLGIKKEEVTALRTVEPKEEEVCEIGG